ncbi:cupin domain-containing protein [Pelagibacterium halotolerans]|uniref:cupin domain-containing protein n=1 Tax=Pelagibacterium halotolerans TaxID=531813 RepID=UPI00384CCF57
MTAQEVIDLLGLERHPEGGWFGETFRDPDPVEGRAHSTAIYYLLAEGEISAWHRVDAVEVWHFYGGAPLALSIAPEAGPAERHILGMDLDAGERPQIVVPRHYWQSARSLGAWTLVGCTVAPGFEFSGFEMAPEGWEPE